MSTTQSTIIAFASGKGGVGKSTSCLGIGGALAKRGHKVTIVDFDQTQTLWSWYASSPAAQEIPNLKVEPAPKDGLDQYVEDLYYKRDGFILIDLAGTMNDLMVLIAAFAELVVIPTRLGIIDVMEAEKIAEKVHQVAARLGSGKVVSHGILINEMPFMPSNSQKHIVKQIEAIGAQIFKTELHSRPSYADPQVTGIPVHYEDQNREPTQKAVAELDCLTDEILAAVGYATDEHHHEEKAAA